MMRAGHATPAASMIYQHPSAARDAEIAARLSGAAARQHLSGSQMARVVVDLDTARKSAEG